MTVEYFVRVVVYIISDVIESSSAFVASVCLSLFQHPSPTMYYLVRWFLNVKRWEGAGIEMQTSSEKSLINTNRKSTTRFPMSIRWSSYVAPKPPKGAQKRKMADFRVKSHFAWRKSATKFLRVKTVSGKVVTFIGLTNCAKIIGQANLSTW